MALPSNTKRKIFDGRYEIISIVGRGADSVVYHARHISGSAQEVALKVLVNRKEGGSLADKLRKEALTLVSCRQKYVVRLDDFHSIDQLCYLSMEYAPFGDLTKYISQKGSPLSPDQAALFLKQSLEALDFIHATGVIHRDLKPENILVINEQEIRLADFGLALLPGDELEIEELKRAVGTFDYLAPEILDGTTFDTRSDLYALGVCFYEVLTGINPFRAAPIAEQMNVRRDDKLRPIQELVPSAPKNLASVISRLLSFGPEDRFQSATDALEALANPSYSGPQKSSAPADAVSILELLDDATPASAAELNTVDTSEEPTSTTFVDEPANQDTPPTRSANPTETFDLERIKSIVAKDSQRKESSSQRRSKPEGDSRQSGVGTKRSTALPISVHRSSTKSLVLNVLQTPIALLAKLPSPLRPVAVAVVSAALTVTFLIISQSGGAHAPRSTTKSPHPPSNATAPESTENSTSEQGEVVRPTIIDLPEGQYSGAITGVIPNTSSPLLLMVNPNSHEMVLMLGVDGWVPAKASTLEADGTFVEAPTFRSNGIILRLNGELSSSEITGTFTDMITGETGVWTAKKAS